MASSKLHATKYYDPWEVSHFAASANGSNATAGTLALQPGTWRNRKAGVCSQWQPGKSDAPPKHVLTVLKLEEPEADNKLTLLDLWPRSMLSLSQGAVVQLLQSLHLSKPRLVIAGLDPADKDLTEVFKRLEPAAKEWDAKEFQALGVSLMLQRREELNGLYFEGHLRLGTQGKGCSMLNTLVELFKNLVPESGCQAPLVAGRVSVARFPDFTRGGSSEVSFLHLDWLADQPGETLLSMKCGGHTLSLYEIGLQARVEENDQKIQSLNATAEWKIGEHIIDVEMELDLEKEELEFYASPDFLIDLDWLGDLFGKSCDAKDAAKSKNATNETGKKMESLLGPLKGSSVKLKLEELGGTISWKDSLKINSLELTISVDMGNGLGVPFAGGWLKPQFTVMCDFSGKDFTVDVEAVGELTWEELKLFARVNTATKTYAASLLWREKQRDIIAEQFLGESSTSPPPASGEDADEMEGLRLSLSGGYGKSASHKVSVSNTKGYKIPIVGKSDGAGKDLTLTLSDLSFKGTYKSGDEGKASTWSIDDVSGKASLSDTSSFSIKGSYHSSPAKQKLEISFGLRKTEGKDAAEALDFEQIFGVGGMAGAAKPAAPPKPKKPAKTLSSLDLTWKHEKKFDAGSSKWKLEKNEVVITAKPEQINLVDALDGMLGWTPDCLEEATLNLGTIKLTASNKELSLLLESPERPKQETGKAGKEAAKDWLSIDIGTAKFSIHNFKFKISSEEEKKQDQPSASRGTPAKPTPQGAGSAAKDATPAKRKLTASVSADMTFHEWGTLGVSYVLGGAWKVGTTLKEPLELKQLINAISPVPLDWELTLENTAFYLTKDGGNFGASLGAYVRGLGQVGLQVLKTDSGWGVGMEMSVDKSTLSKEQKKKKTDLGSSMLAFLDYLSLDNVILGFSTIEDTSGKLGLKGVAATGGKAGFGMSATWKFKPDTTPGAIDADKTGLSKVMDFLGCAAESFTVGILLNKDEQVLSVVLKERPLKVKPPPATDTGIATGKTKSDLPGHGVQMGGTLSLRHKSAQFTVTMEARAKNVLISEVPCEFGLKLAVSVGKAGVGLTFEGYLDTEKGTLVPLYKGSKAMFAKLGLMIGVGSSGVNFGAWGTLSVGSFKASAVIYFAGATQTVVALAISEVTLAQVAGTLFGDLAESEVLKSIKVLGTQVRLKPSRETPRGGKTTVFVPSSDLPLAMSTREAATKLAYDMVIRDEDESTDLALPARVECTGSGDTWHLTDTQTMMQYTLQHQENKGWKLVRKFQFQAASGTVTLGKTTFHPGVALAGRLQILGWKAEATIKANTQGVYLYGHLDPLNIKIFGFSLLALSGSKSVLIEKKPTLVPDPKKGALLSLATYQDTARRVPADVTLNPKFLQQGMTKEQFFLGPHAYVNAYLSVFSGLGTVAVDCQISPRGMSIMGRGTLLSLLECDVDIMLFASSGFLFAADLILKVPALEVGILKINMQELKVGGHLKIQIGGPGIALSASLGASFSYAGESFVLGEIKVTLTQEGLDNIVDMLKNAVVDGLIAKFGLQEAKNLEDKWRWTSVDIINDTPFTMIYMGDSKNPASTDIEPLGYLLRDANTLTRIAVALNPQIGTAVELIRAHGKYWQAPTDIPAWSEGNFSACEKSAAITGCGGVTSYALAPEGMTKKQAQDSKKTVQLHVAWSRPLVNSAGELIEKLKKFFTNSSEKIPVTKCRGTLGGDRFKIWEDFDTQYLTPTYDSGTISRTESATVPKPEARFETEILTFPGEHALVLIRQKNVAAAGKVSTAGSFERAEMAIVSPGGMLYCRTRHSSTQKGVWRHCEPPPLITHAIRQAEVIALGQGQSTIFVLLVIAADNRLYLSQKKREAQKWNDFLFIETLHRPAVSLSVPALRSGADAVTFLITEVKEKDKRLFKMSLSQDRNLEIKEARSLSEQKHTLDATLLSNDSNAFYTGIGTDGLRVNWDRPMGWQDLMKRAWKQRGRVLVEQGLIKKEMVDEISKGHCLIPTARTALTKDMPEQDARRVKEWLLLADEHFVIDGRGGTLDDEILCQDMAFQELLSSKIKAQNKTMSKSQRKSQIQYTAPVRQEPPQNIQRHAALKGTEGHCIVVLDGNGAPWRIRHVANNAQREALNSKWSWQQLALDLKIDDNSYEWRLWAQITPASVSGPKEETKKEEKKQKPDIRFHSLCLGLSGKDKTLQLFTIDQHRRLWHTWSQDDGVTWLHSGPAGTEWKHLPSGTSGLPADVEKVTCSCNDEGELEVFLITSSKALFTSRLTLKTRDSWSEWLQVTSHEPTPKFATK